jgi:(hydroxyamino)benzene mutase
LFLFGLIQGAGIQSFVNPRMALSAHLTAVQSGMALMIAGIVWRAVLLSSKVAVVSRGTIIVGMFGLWAGLTLSAATGAGLALPIAGQGHSATPNVEAVVFVLVVGSSGLVTIGWLLFLIGLARSRTA